MTRRPSSAVVVTEDMRQKQIERAKQAFLVARTAYGRKRALRKLDDLGAGPPKGTFK